MKTELNTYVLDYFFKKVTINKDLHKKIKTARKNLGFIN
jgi:hypothetical protein